MKDNPANDIPWASFCMSTYQRPQFLLSQVRSLLQQTFPNFEIVIADNDPAASGRAVIESLNDPRIQYQCNGTNIGMVKSFNRSVERARGAYIVMVTDDDPVDTVFLTYIRTVVATYPGRSLYGGLKRNNKEAGETELIAKEDLINEFLDPEKTTDVLWSSCLMKKEVLLQIGMLPDYGSPHLVDHAMLAMVGSIDGAVLINRMFSNIVSHQTNFSKSNFDYYYISCVQFYQLLEGFIKDKAGYAQNHAVIIRHLGKWFIHAIFNLLNHYRSAANYDKAKLEEIRSVAEKILQQPFMRTWRWKYRAKSFVLNMKFLTGIKK